MQRTKNNSRLLWDSEFLEMVFLCFWTTTVTQRTTVFPVFMRRKTTTALKMPMQIHSSVLANQYQKRCFLFLTWPHWAADDIWKLSKWHLPKPGPCSPSPHSHKVSGRQIPLQDANVQSWHTCRDIYPWALHGSYGYVLLHFGAIAEDCLDAEGLVFCA